MDPRILQLIMQQQKAQKPDVQDQETPQDAAQPGDQGEDISLGDQFNQNPFEAILARGQAAQAPQPQAGGQPQIPPHMVGQMPGMEDNQLLKGKGTGASKYLISAIQALQGYVAQSQNSDEIAVARSIVKLLLKLIDQDQQSQQDKLPQDTQMAQSMQGGQPQ